MQQKEKREGQSRAGRGDDTPVQPTRVRKVKSALPPSKRTCMCWLLVTACMYAPLCSFLSFQLIGKYSPCLKQRQSPFIRSSLLSEEQVTSVFHSCCLRPWPSEKSELPPGYLRVVFVSWRVVLFDSSGRDYRQEERTQSLLIAFE